jgi:hypothetical protein
MSRRFRQSGGFTDSDTPYGADHVPTPDVVRDEEPVP